MILAVTLQPWSYLKLPLQYLGGGDTAAATILDPLGGDGAAAVGGDAVTAVLDPRGGAATRLLCGNYS
ncbi:hypothetical protein L915_17470, partial [Phytophthora nicotianae]